MQRPGTDSNAARRLNFTMTLPSGAIWSIRGNGTGLEFNSGLLNIGANSTLTGSEVISFSMNGSSTRATQGVYTNNFGNGNHTALTFRANENSSGLNCATGAQGLDRFPFTVQAAIESSCTITTTNDVNLGNYPASAKNILGSNGNAISITCTKDAPYTVGLPPSNVSTTGAGVMSGTTSNTDKVPYQLRSTTGFGGAVWGNTATSTSVGNGVKGTGSGGVQNKTVYVTVPSASLS